VESLGKYFLQLRQSRQIDYPQIWQELKITEQQIKALEQDRYFELGTYGFVKLLVYNYARYLEADLDLVMAEFRIMMPEHTKPEFTPRKNLKEKKILLSTNFLWTLGIVIFVAILGSILLHSYRQGWLNTPEFFKQDKPSKQSEAVVLEEKEEPDSLRQRMRILSESIPQTNVAADLKHGDLFDADNTDYIGRILGESPVNVQIN
jgi:cytoskeletal protein RodZ